MNRIISLSFITLILLFDIITTKQPAAASASARVPGAFPCPPLIHYPSPSQFTTSSPAVNRSHRRQRPRVERGGVGRGARGRRRASQKNIVNT